MDIHLVVVKPFNGLSRGDIVSDKDRIAAILAGEHRHSVVSVVTPDTKKV